MDTILTAQNIRDWLKESGHSRVWLADAVGVKPSTIVNWLNRDRPIPRSKAIAIKGLMEGRNTYREVIAVPVRFTSEEWAEVKRQLGVSTIEEAEPALRAFALERARVTIYAVTHPGDLGAAEAPPPPHP